MLAGCVLVDLLSVPEGGGRKFLRNVGELIPDSKA
jgi:hypothetical protein